MIMNPQFYKSIHQDTEQAQPFTLLLMNTVKRHAVKAIVSAAVFLILLTSFFMMGTNASEQSPAPAAIGEREIVVSTGDTLWGIASQVSNPSDDIRFVVYLIKDRNNLSNTNLTPGQKLIIPTI
jgi:hypothetical protein